MDISLHIKHNKTTTKKKKEKRLLKCILYITGLNCSQFDEEGEGRRRQQQQQQLLLNQHK